MRSVTLLITAILTLPAYASTINGQWIKFPSPKPAQLRQKVSGEAKFTFTYTGADKDELEYYGAEIKWTCVWGWDKGYTDASHSEEYEGPHNSIMKTTGEVKYVKPGEKQITVIGGAQVVKEGEYEGTVEATNVFDYVDVIE